MINEEKARKYCREDITRIKNYAKALADPTETWICHHINGEQFTGFKAVDLIKMNMYYNRPASELMFVTHDEHRTIHRKGATHTEETKKKMSESHKGRTFSDEHRQKLSKSHKGKTSSFKGKRFSEESRKKISAALTGRKLSEETRNKMSAAKRRKK